MKKLSVFGVLIGGVTDIVSTGVFAVPLFIYIIIKFNLIRVPPDQIQAAMAAALHANVGLSIAQWLPGLAGSILGGYVAASIAKHDELLNGALSAYLCVALGIFAWLTLKTPVPIYEHLVGFVGSPFLGMIGGWLRLAQKRSKISFAPSER